MADATWSNQLHIALEEWAAGRTDRAQRSFHRVLEACQAEDMTVWRAFLHNQLALLCLETGQWEEARYHWDSAQQSWNAGGLQPDSPQLAATLGWYADILDHYQFSERARTLRSPNRVPLIDPWQSESSVQSSSVTSSTPSRAEESYLPMGGNSVSVQRTSSVSGTWDELIAQALDLASRANFPRAQNLFDQARHQVVARRVTHPHLLALVYSAESIGAFMAGQYPVAEKARDQARELWRTPEQQSEDLQLFAQTLKAAGQENAAVLFMSRVARHEFPLLDPLTDLQSGVARGEWKAVKVDWLAGLEEACKHYARGNLVECQRRLDNLALQMEPHPSREALLGNLQALLAQAMGEEAESRVFFNRARTRWTHANLLGADLKLLRRYKLEKLADALKAGHLLDPAEHPLLSEIGNATPAVAPTDPPAEIQSVEPPARSSSPITWILTLVLALIAFGAWRLTH